MAKEKGGVTALKQRNLYHPQKVRRGQILSSFFVPIPETVEDRS
jgi:hypothetical protein